MEMVRAVALATAIGAATAAGAAAQLPVIGFRLGVSLSKASTELTDFAVDGSWLTKFAGGGFVRFGTGNIGVQPELMYVSKGIKFETTGGDVDLQMDYVEVPLLLHLGLGAGVVTPYVVAGPAFAFEASCTIGVSDDSASAEVDCDASDEGPVERKKFDVGAMFGGGLAFPAGPGSLLVDGRYNIGLINIVDDDSDDSFKHRTFSFTAGYQIPLGLR